uniref:Replication-associated protein n=1 Tax=Fringilla montifringilla CRESS-DNA-virus sp. TaxID=2815044 RepID=A0A8A4XC07_9VIRU|nr:MAG: replication-associated protein [Fringilla montifringilla CRESS-DNA-virus sp.]
MEGNSFIRFNTLRTKFQGIHYAARLGTAAEARAYCMKEETRDAEAEPVELGIFAASRQGQRSDLSTAVQVLKDGGIKRLIDELPGTYLRYHTGFEKLAEHLREIPKDDDFVPYPWQKKVLDLISQAPDERTIIYVVDSTGNVGKSRLAKHILCNHGGCMLSGQFRDMAYVWDPTEHKVGLFDIPRASSEFVKQLYAFAEALKNGVVNSTKYVPKLKIFHAPHIIFFSNQKPEANLWSADRLKIIDLDVELAHQTTADLAAAAAAVAAATAAQVLNGDDVNARDQFPSQFC